MDALDHSSCFASALPVSTQMILEAGMRISRARSCRVRPSIRGFFPSPLYEPLLISAAPRKTFYPLL